MTSKNITSRAKTLRSIERTLAQLSQDQRTAVEAIEDLRARVLARGTEDVTAAANAVTSHIIEDAPPANDVAPPAPVARPERVVSLSLADKVERALREDVLTLEELCRAVRAPAGPVSAVLKRARAAKRLYNVAPAERAPAWSWIPENYAPGTAGTSVLYPLVARLISVRPFTFAELRDATGCHEEVGTRSRGRVSGAIVALQKRHALRKGPPVLEIGPTGERTAWFLALRRR